MRRAVRYCGGCRITYDRNRARRKIESWLEEALETAQEGVRYDVIILLCGCSASCVTTEDLTAGRFCYVTEMPEEEDLEKMKIR